MSRAYRILDRPCRSLAILVTSAAMLLHLETTAGELEFEKPHRISPRATNAFAVAPDHRTLSYAAFCQAIDHQTMVGHSPRPCGSTDETPIIRELFRLLHSPASPVGGYDAVLSRTVRSDSLRPRPRRLGQPYGESHRRKRPVRLANTVDDDSPTPQRLAQVPESRIIRQPR